MTFTIAGTWVDRSVEVSWRDGVLGGDRPFVAALRDRTASAAPYDVLLAAASLLADDESFRLSGNVPDLDEAAVERTLRAIGPVESERAAARITREICSRRDRA